MSVTPRRVISWNKLMSVFMSPLCSKLMLVFVLMSWFVSMFMSPLCSRLMLGFMLTSWFVSMWMCNTATTSMLLPILESVLRQIEESGDENDSSGIDPQSLLPSTFSCSCSYSCCFLFLLF